MIRCENCQKEISIAFPDVHFNNWLKLMHYFDHELAEEEITGATYDQMFDALISLKPRLEEK